MKKLCTGILLLILLGAGVLLLFNYNNSLGIMRNSITEKSSSRSEITFQVNKDGLIKFDYSSEIETGSLSFELTDNEGTVIKTFDSISASSEKVKLKKNIVYTLSVSYDEFIGNYRIKAAKT